MSDKYIRLDDALEAVREYLKDTQADPMLVWDMEQVLSALPSVANPVGVLKGGDA
jgi:hypothetical protein